MDAIIGRYRIHMEEIGIVLTHPVGFSFGLTLDEAIKLMEFINVYREAIAAELRDTEPQMKRVVVDKKHK